MSCVPSARPAPSWRWTTGPASPSSLCRSATTHASSAPTARTRPAAVATSLLVPPWTWASPTPLSLISTYAVMLVYRWEGGGAEGVCREGEEGRGGGLRREYCSKTSVGYWCEWTWSISTFAYVVKLAKINSAGMGVLRSVYSWENSYSVLW